LEEYILSNSKFKSTYETYMDIQSSIQYLLEGNYESDLLREVDIIIIFLHNFTFHSALFCGPHAIAWLAQNNQSKFTINII